MRIMRTSSRRRVCAALIACALAALATIAPAARSGEEPKRGRLMSKVARMTLEQKVGQMFVTYAYGPSVDHVDERNRTTYGVDSFRQLIERYHLGGIIYFAWSDNVRDPQQIAGLSNGIQEVATTSGADVPMLISTDQEQGVVTRVTEPATQFPGSMALGA